MQSGLNFTSLSQEAKRVDKKSLKSKFFFKKFSLIKFLSIVIVVLQLVILFLLINPVNLLRQLNSENILNKVSSLTTIPSGEIPISIGRIGNNSFLPDINTLKNENEIQSQVYKDARNDDYVIVFSNKMVIYRDSENRVIYEGLTPLQVLNANQQTIVNNLLMKVKDSGIISSDNYEIPQLRVLTSEIQDLKKSNPEFYSDVKENDLQAIFAKENKIILYRPLTEEIIKYGDISIR